jgi:hypothetical protein
MGPTACWTVPSVPHFGHLFVGLVGAGSWTGMVASVPGPGRPRFPVDGIAGTVT